MPLSLYLFPTHMLRSLVPRSFKARLRAAHRALTFRRAMRQLIADPVSAVDNGPLIDALEYGWNNEGWAATPAYLRSMVHTVAAAPAGDVLECGSGLSTLLLAAMASKTGRQVVALEHVPAWAARVRRALEQHGLSRAATVIDAPLRPHSAFSWYDHAPNGPARYAVVVCDGPPSTTQGGRYGLLPVMRAQLGNSCVILLDDAARAEEQAILARWGTEFGTTTTICEGTNPFASVIFQG